MDQNIKDQNKKIDLKEAGIAMKLLLMALGANKGQIKEEKQTKKGSSKRGAIHQHRPTFKSRQIFPVTPAQFRRSHMGDLKKKESEKNGS